MSGFTHGPWEFVKNQKWPFGVRVVAANGDCIMAESAIAHSTVQNTREECELGYGFKGKEIAKVQAAIAEQDANASLIAEAGTVAHETGLTPRQLAEQRAELLEALQKLVSEYRYQESIGNLGCDRIEIQQAQAAIAKATAQNNDNVIK